MQDHTGVIGPSKLPIQDHLNHWERLLMEPAQKNALVNQIILEMTTRAKISRSVCPLHGLMLLTGPPGTGKTTLAKASASKAAQIMGSPIRFMEIEPHGLTSSAMGRTQRKVQELLQQTVAEAATAGPLIVLIDEAETLAADRNKLSLEANPIDVHRATDAVLASLDLLAEKHPQLLFIATTNFEKALDDAFKSRADFVMHIGKPNATAAESILRDTLEQLGKMWPNLAKLAKSNGFSKTAKAAHGLDGRRIRKSVLQACTSSQETAMDPGKLSLVQLEAVLKSLKEDSK